jgi:hypothetical protein
MGREGEKHKTLYCIYDTACIDCVCVDLEASGKLLGFATWRVDSLGHGEGKGVFFREQKAFDYLFESVGRFKGGRWWKRRFGGFLSSLYELGEGGYEYGTGIEREKKGSWDKGRGEGEGEVRREKEEQREENRRWGCV